MRYAITGASGLLGANLAEILLARGHEVVATKRGTSRVDHLAKLAIEWVEAGLEDVDALARAFEGADGVFHCAAAVSIQRRVTPAIRAANVTGTENVLAAVAKSGAKRLLHCSTTAAVGISEDGRPIDESARFNMPERGLDDAYVTTKREAEIRVMASKVPAVIVNPGYLIGPYDVQRGRLILEQLLGKTPGHTDAENSFVDARDVAKGMIAALERGGDKERYILGGHNLSYREFFRLVADTTGARFPSLRVPSPLVRLLGALGDAQHAITGKEGLLSGAKARWATTRGFVFSSAKAERALGYTISPLAPAIRDSVEFFRAQGMI